jgi:hypothetical protein
MTPLSVVAESYEVEAALGQMQSSLVGEYSDV